MSATITTKNIINENSELPFFAYQHEKDLKIILNI